MLNPTPLTAPQPASGLSRAGGAVLRLLVKGFTPSERQLLEGTVKLSQRRDPRIDLVGEADAMSADIVMIDAHDPVSFQWAAAQSWLAGKAVIWAGAKAARPGQMVIERHVKWPILPVLLYRALEHRLHGGAATPEPAAKTANRRVLIVDDSLAARAHLRGLLERQGILVTEADSAEAGIAAAAADSFACVLMDILMPGIDGLEACRRIKARARSGTALPVVMLTSKSSPFDRVRGKMAGCDSYLTKPVDAAQLHEVIARHVGQPAVARASFPNPSLAFNPQ